EGTLLATPLWAALPAEAPRHSPAYAGHHILLCELDALSSLGVEQLVAGSQCGSLQSTAASLAVRYEAYALACFELIKRVSAARAPGTVLIQVVVPNTPAHAVLAGVAGLLKTAALENPHMVGQVILVDPATTAEHLADTLTAHAGLGYGGVLRQENAQHQYLTWDVAPAITQVPAHPVFKEGGVYLITGGLGALGRLFAREILTQTSGATLILTGRSELSGAGQAQLDALTALGGNIAYRRVDIADPAQVTTLIGDITRQHRRLDGIIHSAGVIADNFIVK
ncbi:SDR family NAD(P)-dependent oxidoreductase, partial [Serratia proteamaculans]